jgi:hypothetical protein
MVLHNTKNEDGIKYFFQEVYELYIKVQSCGPLTSPCRREKEGCEC